MSIGTNTGFPGRRASIGIDIGGTKMLGCLFGDDLSRPIKSISRPTAHIQGGQAVLEQAAAMVEELRIAANCPVSNLGIALPELVDKMGRPSSAWNFDWRGLDIASAFSVGCHVHLESDVRAAAFAESRLSELKELDPFLYVTFSTGIAHSLVIGGKPYVGANGYALNFSGSDLVTQCGNCGSVTPFNLELFAGGRALGDRYSATSGKRDQSARDLIDATDSDPGARKMIDDAILAFASYLGQLINTLDPAAVIIGGSIGTRCQIFEQLQSLVRQFIWSESARELPIRPSKLDGNAAAIGAVFMAASKCERTDQ